MAHRDGEGSELAELVERLRNARGKKETQEVIAALAALLRSRALRKYPKFSDGISETDFDDIVSDVLFGKPSPTGQETKRSLGFIRLVQRDDFITAPLAYFYAMVESQAKDYLRRKATQIKYEKSQKRSSKSQEPANLNLDPEHYERIVLDIPTKVANTFENGAHWLAIWSVISSSNQDKAINNYLALYKYLTRDIQLKHGRLPWDTSKPVTLDNHARAWQVRYHKHHGFSDFLHEGEPPDSKDRTRRNRFDQHVKRFRDRFRDCSSMLRGAVEEEPAAKAAKLDQKWTPVEDPTL